MFDWFRKPQVTRGFMCASQSTGGNRWAIEFSEYDNVETNDGGSSWQERLRRRARGM